jgi:hypothetical protein
LWWLSNERKIGSEGSGYPAPFGILLEAETIAPGIKMGGEQ